MRVRIFLRKTEDWFSVKTDKLVCYYEPNRVNAVIDGPWKEGVPVPYTEYRGRLKQICMDQWPVEYVYFRTEDIEDDDYFLPTDDDDWHHPEIEEFVKKKVWPAEFAFWDGIRHQTNFEFKYEKWSQLYSHLGSNMYALKGSLLKRMHEDHRHLILHDHTSTWKWAVKYNATSKSLEDYVMSVYNMHPGSATCMTFISSAEQLTHSLTKDPVKCHELEWVNKGCVRLQEYIRSLGFMACAKQIKMA